MYLEKGVCGDAAVYACFLIIRKNVMFIKIFKVSYREGGNTCVGDMQKLDIMGYTLSCRFDVITRYLF